MINSSTTDALFEFGTEVRKKLSSTSAHVHLLNEAIRKENRLEFSHHFLSIIIKSGVEIPQEVSNVLLDILSEEKKVDEFQPFVMGMVGK